MFLHLGGIKKADRMNLALKSHLSEFYKDLFSEEIIEEDAIDYNQIVSLHQSRWLKRCSNFPKLGRADFLAEVYPQEFWGSNFRTYNALRHVVFSSITQEALSKHNEAYLNDLERLDLRHESRI